MISLNKTVVKHFQEKDRENTTAMRKICKFDKITQKIL